jgi:hypothetical protein
MLILCMATIPFGAYAGMIGTSDLVAAVPAQEARDKVQRFIQRSEVRDQLQQLGVSPVTAEARVGALTDAEVASIAGRIDSLPAGGFSAWAAGATLLIIGLIWYYWVK